MGSFAPIRDDAGGIVGMQETTFGRTLTETMAAVGVAEAKPEGENTPARYRPGHREAAALVGGLVLAVAAIAAMNAFSPAPAPRVATATAAPQPTAAPTVTIAPTIAAQAAYDAPGGALLGQIPLTSTLAYQHSAWPGWAGVAWQGGVVWVETGAALADLPDLAPPRPVQRPLVEAPAAAPVVCTLENAPFVASREVLIDGVPLEVVRAASCESQADAESKAGALHDQVLAEATAEAAQPAPAQRSNAR